MTMAAEAKTFSAKQGVVSEIKRVCFYCHKKVLFPRIEWMGNDATIFLHPQCALDLSVRLIRDFHEFDCKKT
jgi:hypothetical protein